MMGAASEDIRRERDKTGVCRPVVGSIQHIIHIERCFPI